MPDMYFSGNYGLQTLTFSHTILFRSVRFFLCCHSNRQKPYHPDQNSLTFILERPLSKQALALLTMISDFFICIRSIPVRKEWFATFEQHPHLRDVEEVFPILEGTRLCVGAPRVHPKLWGGGRCELHYRCFSSLVILPKYACLRFVFF